MIQQSGLPTPSQEAFETDATRADPKPGLTRRRIGFLEGEAIVPEKFDELYAQEICEEFENGACRFPDDFNSDNPISGGVHDPDLPLKS